MNTKTVTLRALGTYLARKALRTITVIFVAIIIILSAVTTLLAAYFNAWWWLLAFPIITIILVFSLLRFMITHVVHLIYRHPYSTKQRQALERFYGTLRQTIKRIALTQLSLATLGDLIRAREVIVLAEFVKSTSAVRQAFSELDEHFGER